MVPLRIASFIGIFASLCTLLAIIVYSIGKFFFGQLWPAGFATTTVLILFSICLNALFLGIVGEYLGRIYRQVKYNTLVIREETINMGESTNPGAPYTRGVAQATILDE